MWFDNAVVRGAGMASLHQAAAVVLETDGSLHVLPELTGDLSALRGVRGIPGEVVDSS